MIVQLSLTLFYSTSVTLCNVHIAIRSPQAVMLSFILMLSLFSSCLLSDRKNLTLMTPNYYMVRNRDVKAGRKKERARLVVPCLKPIINGCTEKQLVFTENRM